jgi:hypothetical protein
MGSSLTAGNRPSSLYFVMSDDGPNTSARCSASYSDATSASCDGIPVYSDPGNGPRTHAVMNAAPPATYGCRRESLSSTVPSAFFYYVIKRGVNLSAWLGPEVRSPHTGPHTTPSAW